MAWLIRSAGGRVWANCKVLGGCAQSEWLKGNVGAEKPLWSFIGVRREPLQSLEEERGNKPKPM